MDELLRSTPPLTTLEITPPAQLAPEVVTTVPPEIVATQVAVATETQGFMARTWEAIRVNKKGLAMFTAGIMLAGSGGVAGGKFVNHVRDEHDVLRNPVAASSAPARPVASKSAAAQAPALNPRSAQIVQNLINSPENPDIANNELANNETVIQSEHPAWAYSKDRNQALFDARQHEASKLGLTVFNPTEVLSQMNTVDPNVPNRLTSTEYLTLTNQFLANYGVQVTLNKQVPAATFNNANTKQWLTTIVTAFAAVPKEYVTPLGTQQIDMRMASPDKNGNDFAAFIELGTPHDTIVTNLYVGSSPTYIWHELQHGWDELESGGVAAMNNDPTFVATDEGAPFGSLSATQSQPLANIEGFTTIDQFNQAKDAITTDFFKNHFASVDCMSAADADEQKVIALGAKTIYPSNYGATKPIEQKAEDGLNVPNMEGWAEVTNPWTPQIDKQFNILVTRLYDRSPALATYFIQMAYRGETFGNQLSYYQIMCNKSGLPVGPGAN